MKREKTRFDLFLVDAILGRASLDLNLTERKEGRKESIRHPDPVPFPADPPFQVYPKPKRQTHWHTIRQTNIPAVNFTTVLLLPNHTDFFSAYAGFAERHTYIQYQTRHTSARKTSTFPSHPQPYYYFGTTEEVPSRLAPACAFQKTPFIFPFAGETQALCPSHTYNPNLSPAHSFVFQRAYTIIFPESQHPTAF